MDASIRNRRKQEVAHSLAEDGKFNKLRSNGQREAYIQMQINSGKLMDFAKSEINTIANMAQVIIETEFDDGGLD
jgi:hypothetical protein